MLLVFDIGNTNVYMGLWQDDAWRWTWRAQTVASKMPDEYAVLVQSFLGTAGFSFKDITGVAIGSVVPTLTAAFVELTQRYMQCEPLVISHQTKLGIRIDIEQPEQAGADRIINAAAVAALYGGPAIVIDLGTATTFDIVSADGAYSGGAIAPGIMVAHDALVSRAARLHKIDLVPPPNPIGRNTIHAMQSGIFWGYVGLVEGMVVRLKEAMGGGTIKVIGTGGLARLISENTKAIDFIASELTLDGMRIIYEMNFPPNK
jgi:type III pantothenate kinase